MQICPGLNVSLLWGLPELKAPKQKSGHAEHAEMPSGGDWSEGTHFGEVNSAENLKLCALHVQREEVYALQCQVLQHESGTKAPQHASTKVLHTAEVNNSC